MKSWSFTINVEASSGELENPVKSIGDLLERMAPIVRAIINPDEPTSTPTPPPPPPLHVVP